MDLYVHWEQYRKSNFVKLLTENFRKAVTQMKCYSSVQYITLNSITSTSYVITNSVKKRARIQI
jgi:hypothetical protein